jgi:hypothetical protein
MRKGFIISVLMLLLAAIPADAFFFGRHHVYARHHVFTGPVFQTPVIHSVGNAGVVLGRPSDNTSPIYVDSSVKAKIANAKSNLADANSILQKLLEKNKITSASDGAATTGSATTGSATIDNPFFFDSPPPR